MIAKALSIGIGKRELLEDYYPDELGYIIEEHNIIHGMGSDDVEEERVGALEFLGALS